MQYLPCGLLIFQRSFLHAGVNAYEIKFRSAAKDVDKEIRSTLEKAKTLSRGNHTSTHKKRASLPLPPLPPGFPSLAPSYKLNENAICFGLNTTNFLSSILYVVLLILSIRCFVFMFRQFLILFTAYISYLSCVPWLFSWQVLFISCRYRVSSWQAKNLKKIHGNNRFKSVTKQRKINNMHQAWTSRLQPIAKTLFTPLIV